MSDAAVGMRARWPDRAVVWGAVLLLATVPLVPFRYLLLPDLLPSVLQRGVQFAPAVVSGLLAAVWLWWRRGQWISAMEGVPLAVPVVALLLTGVVSSVGAREPVVSLAKTVYYFVTGGMLYLVLVDTLKARGRARVPLYVLLGAAYVAAVAGVLEFALGESLVYGRCFAPENEAYRRLIPDPWFGRRIVSTIGHPGVLGSYLMLVLPISVSATLRADRRRVQAILAAGSLVVLAGLVLTFSRGAWLAALVSMGVYLKLRGTRHLLALPLVAAVLVAVVLGFGGVSEVVTERAADAYENYVLNFTSTTRGAAYAYAATIANTHPLTGLGTGMYRFAAYDLRRTLDVATPLGVLDTPDNMYLVWLAENGAMGLCAAVYMLAALLRHLWRAGKVQADPVRRDLAWGAIAAVAGLCVNMLTVDVLYFHVTRTAFWIMMGVMVGMVAPEGSMANDRHD